MNRKNLLFLATWLASGLASCGGAGEAAQAPGQPGLAQVDSTKALNDQVLGVARIEPADGLLNLSAGTSGKVVAVAMDENQQVAQGQVLLAVEVAVESAQLAQAQSKVAAQEAAVEAGQANLGAQKVSLENARATYERNRQLYEGKALTKENLDNSKAALDKLVNEVAAAEANLRQARARVGELQADIAYFRTVVAQKTVLAPTAGKVLSVLVKPGEYVGSDTQVAEFAPAGSLIAKTEVDELFAEKIRLGQRATILSQTTGQKLAEGQVSYAADYLKAKSLFKDQATEQEDRRVREVHIRLEAGQQPLIGSRVDCLIELK
jgi:multidrug resistance efflux pump